MNSIPHFAELLISQASSSGEVKRMSDIFGAVRAWLHSEFQESPERRAYWCDACAAFLEALLSEIATEFAEGPSDRWEEAVDACELLALLSPESKHAASALHRLATATEHALWEPALEAIVLQIDWAEPKINRWLQSDETGIAKELIQQVIEVASSNVKCSWNVEEFSDTNMALEASRCIAQVRGKEALQILIDSLPQFATRARSEDCLEQILDCGETLSLITELGPDADALPALLDILDIIANEAACEFYGEYGDGLSLDRIAVAVDAVVSVGLDAIPTLLREIHEAERHMQLFSLALIRVVCRIEPSRKSDLQIAVATNLLDDVEFVRKDALDTLSEMTPLSDPCRNVLQSVSNRWRNDNFWVDRFQQQECTEKLSKLTESNGSAVSLNNRTDVGE